MRLCLWILLPAIGTATLFVVPSWGDQQVTGGTTDQVSVPKDQSSVWMRKKMDYSQAILRGLALGDFDLIATNARQMKLLNKVEGFVRRRNPRYTDYVRSFQQINQEIIEQADERNLAGVTLAFNQLTVNCVNCHRSLRSRGDAPADSIGNP